MTPPARNEPEILSIRIAVWGDDNIFVLSVARGLWSRPAAALESLGFPRPWLTNSLTLFGAAGRFGGMQAVSREEVPHPVWRFGGT